MTALFVLGGIAFLVVLAKADIDKAKSYYYDDEDESNVNKNLFDDDEYTNPAYCHLPWNIHYDSCDYDTDYDDSDSGFDHSHDEIFDDGLSVLDMDFGCDSFDDTFDDGMSDFGCGGFNSDDW